MKPTDDRVIVEVEKVEDKTVSGLTLSTKEKKDNIGVVKEVGVNTKEVKKGDTIMFSNSHHIKDDLYVLREKDVMVIMEA